MRLLILGGTVFLGRALTDAALAHGHEVTHVNRGRSSSGDERVQALRADRADASALRKALGERRWDAAIDTSGYMPQVVGLAGEALAGRVARYLFVSSISVYAAFEGAGLDEEAPVSPPPDPLPETLDMALYGPLKSACEAVVREAWGAQGTIVRPGLIVGPHDPTDRFTYWPVRISRGGKVLAPGRAQRPVQFIDVRDLAEWMLHLLERDVVGTFNAAGPQRPLAMGELLEACAGVSGRDARFEWFADEELLAAGVVPWTGLPLWIPESDGPMNGLMAISIARALAEGLRFRPLAQTIADTLAWASKRPADHPWRAGLAAQKESELLQPR